MGGQIFAADAVDAIQRTDGGEAERMARPEHPAGNGVGIDLLPLLVQILPGLFGNDPFFNLESLQQWPDQHGRKNFHAAPDMVGVDTGIVAGRLGIGGRIGGPADGLEGVFDLQGGAEIPGAAEQHMLQEMGKARFARRIVAAANLQVDRQFGGMQMGHLDADHPQAVVQCVYEVADHIRACRMDWMRWRYSSGARNTSLCPSAQIGRGQSGSLVKRGTRCQCIWGTILPSSS